MEFKNLLAQAAVQPYLQQVRLGVERETQRVTSNGQLATSNHPAAFGDRSFHPYIQTDFAETQLELDTPVANSTTELFQWLTALHQVARRSLPTNEMLWPLSMPPALPAAENEIVLAKLEQSADVLYRRYLAKTYGRRKQMVCGLHYNFEFGPDLIAQLFAGQTEFTDLQAFKNELYLHVARNYLHYRWLLTYLFGASPLSEPGYFSEKQAPTTPVRSLRNSHWGYTNHDRLPVSFASLPDYLNDLHQLVKNETLLEEKEFYAAVRLRGGQSVMDVAHTGINYLELRNLDLNPSSAVGITKAQTEFLNLFMLLLLWLPETAAPATWIAQGQAANEQVALEPPTTKTALTASGHDLVAALAELVQTLDLPHQMAQVTWLQEALDQPQLTLAVKMVQQFNACSQVQWATKLAEHQQQQAWQRPYQFQGFQKMELSSQLLLFDALQIGLQVDVLDRASQFIRLQHADHAEYVKNGNMTSRDTYVTSLIMANKTVTKKILAAAGFQVPLGNEYATLAEAKQAFTKFSKSALVVKPQETNDGVGITIFKQPPRAATYYHAVQTAFKRGHPIMVEKYFPGNEYRFLIIGDQVRSILHRIPANVTGDGQHTISQLVALKNQSPRRGHQHRAPATELQLGDCEQQVLASQGWTPQTILANNQQAFLRENSNISTAGDAIDVTTSFDPSYCEQACAAVRALGAQICGLDIIIPDRHQPANPSNFTIIEANFNPEMDMHVYPANGNGQRVTRDVLALLFPELPK